MAALTTGAGIFVMSRALRSNTFLKIISRPKGVRPGSGEEYDRVGRAFEIMYEGIGQTAPRSGGQGISPPVPTVQTEQPQESSQPQAPLPNDIFNPIPVPSPQPPQFGDLAKVSPLLVPDPATRATFGMNS
jgi:hypothetical protein